jgi:predicted nucleic acid-binding protein
VCEDRLCEQFVTEWLDQTVTHFYWHNNHYLRKLSTMTTAEILQSARKMRADEQLKLIDSLFEMIDEPDPAIAAAWTAEAQDRLAALDRGALSAEPIVELFAKLRLQ